MYLKLTIQERLKDLRVEKGLTLEQLAEQTGISKSALGKYETEEYKDMSSIAAFRTTPRTAFKSFILISAIRST